jgi:hypothetical protein
MRFIVRQARSWLEDGKHGLECLRFDGFDEEKINTRLARPLLVPILPPPGQRDQDDRGRPRLPTQLRRDLIAVEARHPDIEQNRVGPVSFGRAQRRPTVVGNLGLVSHQLEHHAQRHCRIMIIVHHEDAARRRRTLTGGQASVCGGARHEAWQRDHELAAATLPVTMRFDRAAMHPDQPFGDGQSESKPGLAGVTALTNLREHLEHPGQHLVRHADAVVTDSDHRVIVSGRDPDRDAAARRGVLRGIVEQVGKHLRQPRDIGIDMDRRVGQHE